jgi:addiction module HigA family antidote
MRARNRLQGSASSGDKLRRKRRALAIVFGGALMIELSPLPAPPRLSAVPLPRNAGEDNAEIPVRLYGLGRIIAKDIDELDDERPLPALLRRPGLGAKSWICSTAVDLEANGRRPPMTAFSVFDMKSPARPGEIIGEEYMAPSGLTVTGAAKGLGVSRESLSELLNGRRGVSIEMAQRLAPWRNAAA